MPARALSPLVFIVALLTCAAAWAKPPVLACGEAARKTSFHKALTQCRKERAAKLAQLGKAGSLALDAPFACQADGPSADVAGLLEQQKLCADPAGYACRARQTLFDSECHFHTFSFDDLAVTPEAIEADCRLEKEVEAGAVVTRRGCPDGKFHVSDAERTWNIFYKPHLASFKAKLEQVRAQALRDLEGSTKIGDFYRKELLRRIKAVRAPESSKDIEDDWCGPASMGLDEKSVIKISPYEMVNVDNMNPNALRLVLAHEMGHSIDPCTLEVAAVTPDMNFHETFSSFKHRTSGKPINWRPRIADTVYPGVMACVRGGTGPDGCNGAFISCYNDTKPGNAETRKQCLKKALTSEDGEACMELVENTPSCSWGLETIGEVPVRELMKIKTHVAQDGEAFPDFFAAEVMGGLLHLEQVSGKFGPQAQKDALLSIASLVAASRKEMGWTECSPDSATRPDTHSSFALRINRLFMGSAALREALGCYGGPPKTPGAGADCALF